MVPRRRAHNRPRVCRGRRPSPRHVPALTSRRIHLSLQPHIPLLLAGSSPAASPKTMKSSLNTLAAALLAAAFLSGCGPAKPPAPPAFATHWQDETQFIVESTVLDLTQMAYFAKHGSAIDATTLVVDARELPAEDGTLTYHVTVRHPDSSRSNCRSPSMARSGTRGCTRLSLPSCSPTWASNPRHPRRSCRTPGSSSSPTPAHS